VIKYFRPNCLFRNFDVKGGADRTLIYLTLSMQQMLRECERHKARADGEKAQWIGVSRDSKEMDEMTRAMKVCLNVGPSAGAPGARPQAVSDARRAGLVRRRPETKPVITLVMKRRPLGGMFPVPNDIQEGETWRLYMKQAREELATRTLDVLYYADGSKNKWWNSFAKRKFMGKELK